MNLKRRLMTGLATILLSIGGGAVVATTAAQAALDGCPQDGGLHFCLYPGTSWTGTPEVYSASITRNTCYPVRSQNDNSVWNATGVRWFLFHTTTCDGTRLEIAPDWAGALPAGWNAGQTHAFMRTSTTS